MMNLIPYRILPVVLALIALIGAGYVWGHHAATNAASAAELVRVSAQEKETLKAVENNTRIAQQQEIDKRKVTNDYLAEIAKVRAAAAHPAGGLYLPATACHPLAAAATSGDAGRTDAATAGTVALPDAITSDLRRLASDADEVTATARALQEAVRTSGCYAQ